jgi:glycosyltransferase involved in cell wall biosynthesis
LVKDDLGQSQPRVAVLLPVHAGADAGHLEAALASMRAQTHSNLRLFVYCDGPLHQAHEQILAKYLRCDDGQDCLVRGIRPAGLPTGLNQLIEAALKDGDVTFLARMDADDISMPERIARQTDFLIQRPEVSIVGTWCIEFVEPNVPLFYKRLPSEAVEVRRFMLFRNPLAHPTVMFRRAIFEQGNRYDPGLPLMQDYELWSRLIVAGETISNVPEFLLWFRTAEGFFNRRHGVRRAWTEVKLRFEYARRARLFKPAQLAGLFAIFLVRVLPGAVKRLAYLHRR